MRYLRIRFFWNSFGILLEFFWNDGVEKEVKISCIYGTLFILLVLYQRPDLLMVAAGLQTGLPGGSQISPAGRPKTHSPDVTDKKYFKGKSRLLRGHIVLPVNNQHFFIGQQQVAILVTEVIGVALPGLVLVGKIMEIKALQHQVLLAGSSFTQGT